MKVQRLTPRRTAEGSATVALPDLAQLLGGVKPEAMKETLVRIRMVVHGRQELDRVVLLNRFPGHIDCIDAYGDGRVRIELSLQEPSR